MDTPTSSIELLVDRTEAYSKTAYELAKLKSLETTTLVVTNVVSRISVIVMVALFILVFTIGIALALGDVLGKAYYGFFIVAAFYLLAAILLHFFLSHWIKKPLSDLIITQALQ